MVKTRHLSPKPIFDEPSLRNFLCRYDAKTVHMGKIWRHLIAHPDCPLDEIPGIPANIRAPLKEEFTYLTSTVLKVVESQIDSTIKLLIRLQDGAEIEAVLIHHSGEAQDPEQRQADRCGERDTLCISSQVGCALRCTFCATGTMGLQGNLWSGEIQEQLVHANSIRTVRNVVFMGMGEPLENYEGVVQAIRGLVDNGKFGLAPRSVTVSTVGIVANMRRLMNDLPQIKLAVSLHAPTQELREKIVPIAKTFKLDTLMDVVDEYASKVTNDGKRKGMVMMSYTLLDGVNDSDRCAIQLRDLVKDRPVIVNLIPYNPFDGNPHDYRTPSAERVDAFLNILEEAGIRVFERRHHGRDIGAACGQLAKLNMVTQPVEDIESCSGKLAKERMRKVPAIAPVAKDKQNLQGAAVYATLSISVAASALLLLRWRRNRS
jgi:sorting nexin-8